MQLPYPEVSGGKWMAQVHVFCDESGKVHSSDWISFCGFLGVDEHWKTLLSLWRALRIELHLPPIHVSAMLHPDEKNGWLKVKERWGTDYQAKCDEALDRFARIIEKSEVLAIGAVVDTKSFRQMTLPNLKNDTYNDPHYLAFSFTVLRSLELVTWGDTDATLGLLLDDDEEKSLNCYHLLRSLKQQSAKAKERISGICFVNDAVYPGIQGADMLAHEARRLMTDQLPPSQRFLDMTRRLEYQPLMFNATKLQEMESDLERTPADKEG